MVKLTIVLENRCRGKAKAKTKAAAAKASKKAAASDDAAESDQEVVQVLQSMTYTYERLGDAEFLLTAPSGVKYRTPTFNGKLLKFLIDRQCDGEVDGGASHQYTTIKVSLDGHTLSECHESGYCDTAFDGYGEAMRFVAYD